MLFTTRRFIAASLAVLSLSGLLSDAAKRAQPNDDLKISGDFLSNRAAALNGARTPMEFNVTNTGSKKYILKLMSGAFINPANSSHVTRKLKPFMYHLPIDASETKSIQYNLHASFESQEKFEMALLLLLQFKDSQGTVFQNVAYDDKITIDEPELSFFDIQVLSIYLMGLAGLAGLGYWIKETYITPSAVTGKTKAYRPSRAEIEEATAEKANKLDTDWIPEQHLKSAPGSRRRKA